MSDIQRTIRELEAQRSAALDAERQRQENERRAREQSPAVVAERIGYQIAALHQQEREAQFEQQIDAALDTLAQNDLALARFAEALNTAEQALQAVIDRAQELDHTFDSQLSQADNLLKQRFSSVLEQRLGVPVGSTDAALEWLSQIPERDTQRRKLRIGLLFSLTGQLWNATGWNALAEVRKRVRAARAQRITIGGSYL